MLIITMRTDQPQAELGLYRDAHKLTSLSWSAHRELAETIHIKIQEILKEQSLHINNLDGIVIFAGPGSFTGLRIGFSVANALAFGLQKPIVATSGDDWWQKGIEQLQNGKGQKTALPYYGAEPKTTQQRK